MPTTSPRRKVTTDEGLYAAFRDRADERALEALVERHWEPTFHLALAVVRDPGAAEDAAQRAFLRVVEAARSARTLDPFKGWLRTVVVNEARMHLRAEKTRARIERAPIEKASVGATSERAPTDPAAAVREYAEGLPDSLREPLVLHFGLGFSHVEIAEAIGAPRTTVTSRIREGTERIRRSLEVASAGAAAAGLDELLAPALDPRRVKAPARPDVRSLLAKGSRLAPLVAAASGVKLLLAAAVAALTITGVVLVGGRDAATEGVRSPVASTPLAEAIGSSARTGEEARTTLRPATASPESTATGAGTPATGSPSVAVKGGASKPVSAGLRVTGSVVRAEGAPFAGAQVRIYSGPVGGELPEAEAAKILARHRETRAGYARRTLERVTNGEVLEVGAGETSRDGAFDITIPAAALGGLRRLLVEAHDPLETLAGFREVETFEPGTARHLDPLVLRGVGTVLVRVRAAGRPEPGVSVEVTDTDIGTSNWGVIAKKQTDGEGVTAYVSAAPSVTLEVRKAGFATEVLEVALNGAEKNVELDLTLAARVTGVVRDSKGLPVAGAQISLFELDSEEGQRDHFRVIGRSMPCDRDGRFEVGEVRPGTRCKLVAFPPEERHDLPFAAMTFLRVPATDVVLSFEPAARAVVVPTFEEGVKPVAVSFRHDKRKADGSWGERAHSRHPEANGVEEKDVFEGLTPGTYRFYVDSADFAATVSAEVTVAGGDDVKVAIKVLGGRKVAGRVVSASGEAVTGEVSLPWGASADLVDGRFVFEHFPPGDVTLTVAAEGCEPVQVLVRDGAAELLDVVVSARRR